VLILSKPKTLGISNLFQKPPKPTHFHSSICILHSKTSAISIIRSSTPKTFGHFNHFNCDLKNPRPFQSFDDKNFIPANDVPVSRPTRPKKCRILPAIRHLTYMKWFLGLLLILNPVAWAQPTPHTKATLYLSDSAAKPGSTITAALHLKMDPGWHTYWKNSGDSGKATKITWDLPPGVTAGEIQWPAPEKVELDGLFTYAYHEEAALLIPLTIGADAPAGNVAIKAKANWLECEKACVPGSAKIEVGLTIGGESKPSPDADKIKQWQQKIPKPATDIALTARWDGPATLKDRPIVFTINKSSGAWDFFNEPVEDIDLSGKTDTLPAADGKIQFRKVATNNGTPMTWPKQFVGLALISGDEKSAAVVTVPIAEATATTFTETGSATQQRGIAYILALAFIGGLILNIMPCVLPVIALKILGFVRQANEDPSRVRKLGLIYGLGVIVSFLGLAAFVILIKQAGRAASWGMQFQNPAFLVFITVLVTLVAMNLFGVFEVTVSGKAMDAAGGLASREGASGAFFNGVLATVLATPCTAPFLGIALGFAFASSNAIILLVFLNIALGLAAPYVILCWFPAWLKKMPKPGAWMEKFKIGMGFPMLATAAWLFSLAAQKFGKPGALYLGLLLVMLGFAAWLFGEFVQRGTKRRALAGSLAFIVAVASFFIFSRGVRAETDAIAWQNWTPAAVQAARAKGQPVIVDFTADWCLTCQANKKTSIEIASVREKIKSLGVAPFLADNTDESPAIIAELAKYKRAGVPLVLVFPADPKADAIVLPEVLTPSLVLDALDKASASRPVASK
jgi:thiol:disulfide interchange protein